MEPDQVLPWLMLAMAEGGSGQPIAALLDPAARPDEVLTWTAAQAQAQGVPEAAAHRLSSPRLRAEADAALAAAQARGVRVLCPPDPDYPATLRDLPLRPAALFALGDVQCLARERPTVTIVGTRTPTPYGCEAARHFATALAEVGIGLVSGLALGIDALVHQCALAQGAPTLAVLAAGLDAIYPREHEALARDLVARRGLLLSEAPCGRAPHRGAFPRRNRLLAALGAGVLVIEAGIKSGTLITARWALDYGRAVFAVPGAWSSPHSAGCHALIADGAQIATDPTELLAALCLSPTRSPAASTQLAGDASDQELMALLRTGPLPFDQAARESGADRAAFLLRTTRLIAAGRLRRLPGNLLALGR